MPVTYRFCGRQVPTEVIERALQMFDDQIGLDQAIAEVEEHERALRTGHTDRDYVTTRQTVDDLEQAIESVQRLVAQYAPPDRSLVDELIAERRAEAARE